MGCFLIITSRDFAQLSATMKASVSVVGSGGWGSVKIQVHPSYSTSAHQMASEIREQTRSSLTASASPTEQQRTIPTRERFVANAALLAEISPALLLKYSESVASQAAREIGTFYWERGKSGELVARQILEQEGYLRGSEATITSSTGPDVAGKNLARNPVVVEVKTRDVTKDFGKLLAAEPAYKEASPDGKGYRQGSDGWLQAAGKKSGQLVSTESTTVLGVHLNPETRKATIYRRVDSDATQWKPLMTRNLTMTELEQASATIEERHDCQSTFPERSGAAH